MDDQSDDELDEVPPEEVAVSYALDDWSTESRELLDRLLTSDDIVHEWQGGTLNIGGEDEALADELIAEVEATLLPGLDPDAEKVLYEVAEWSPEDRADLTDALAVEGVRYAFDDMGDLLVEAIDEDRVDDVVAKLVGDEADDGEEAPAASDVLSELFVAADKLRKQPRDAKAIASAIEEGTTVIKMPAPYGFERRIWAQVGLRAGALRAALEDEVHDDEVVSTAAEELRDLLHPMV